MKIKLLVITMILFAFGGATIQFSPTINAQIEQLPPLPTPPAPASTPPKTGEDEVIKINTELVTLTATVTDKNGRYRADLKQKDFTVFEDGGKQEISYFNTGDRVPMSLGIICDTSGSMEDKIEGVQDAIEHFVKSVAPNDEIFLVKFSDDAELVQDFTADRKKILRAANSLNPRGGTALYDGVQLGLQKLSEGKNKKRALLLLTDGNDTASQISLETAVSLARRSEAIVYALGIGHGERGSLHSGIADSQIRDTIDMRALRAFSDATGGNAYYLENAHEGGRDLVDEAAAEVAAELKQQYTLGYYPTNQKRDGGFRQIVVEVSDKSMRVRTKRGYYANGSDDNGRTSRIFITPNNLLNQGGQSDDFAADNWNYH